eukprot:Hpha_TRINITY_DN16321_c3_g9::TRINITY_DN16321_c3_g9_i1::g.57821::m.57821
MAGAPSQTVCAVATMVDAVADGQGSPRGQQTLYDTAEVPNLSIVHYIHRWVRYTGVSDKVVVAAAIIVDRVAFKSNIKITTTNAHRLMLAALLLCTKLSEDMPNTMPYYARVGGVTPKDLFNLERRLLQDIDFCGHVTAEQVGHYSIALECA